jgi:pilus assembly protein CpaB
VGADDTQVSEQVEIDQRDLLGIIEERVVVAPEERVCTVRRRSGEETIEVPIPCTN